MAKHSFGKYVCYNYCFALSLYYAVCNLYTNAYMTLRSFLQQLMSVNLTTFSVVVLNHVIIFEKFMQNFNMRKPETYSDVT